ncbi:MAG: hypothetical protein PVH88_19080 [Ignavibacteria bacterium]|jgi:hypothetical protein
MSTLPPPATKPFSGNTIEKKCYNIVEKFKEFIPIPNDRNRLGFCLVKFMEGEGDPPEVLVKSTKIEIEGISKEELAVKLDEELNKINN